MECGWRLTIAAFEKIWHALRSKDRGGNTRRPQGNCNQASTAEAPSSTIVQTLVQVILDNLLQATEVANQLLRVVTSPPTLDHPSQIQAHGIFGSSPTNVPASFSQPLAQASNEVPTLPVASSNLAPFVSGLGLASQLGVTGLLFPPPLAAAQNAAVASPLAVAGNLLARMPNAASTSSASLPALSQAVLDRMGMQRGQNIGGVDTQALLLAVSNLAQSLRQGAGCPPATWSTKET